MATLMDSAQVENSRFPYGKTTLELGHNHASLWFNQRSTGINILLQHEEKEPTNKMKRQIEKRKRYIFLLLLHRYPHTSGTHTWPLDHQRLLMQSSRPSRYTRKQWLRCFSNWSIFHINFNAIEKRKKRKIRIWVSKNLCTLEAIPHTVTKKKNTINIKQRRKKWRTRR